MQERCILLKRTDAQPCWESGFSGLRLGRYKTRSEDKEIQGWGWNEAKLGLRIRTDIWTIQKRVWESGLSGLRFGKSKTKSENQDYRGWGLEKVKLSLRIRICRVKVWMRQNWDWGLRGHGHGQDYTDTFGKLWRLLTDFKRNLYVFTNPIVIL